MPRGLMLAALVMLAPSARAMDPTRPLQRLQVTTFDRRAGFPAASVYALAQSNDGYLWIGSNVGLYRYDGRRFEAFRRESYPGLPSDFIHNLHPAGDRLWIASARGLALLRGGEIVDFGAARGLAGANVYAVVEDRAGGVWVSTPTTVYRLTGDAFEKVTDEAAAQMFAARDGAVWLAGQQLRVWRDGALAPLTAVTGHVYAIVEAADGTVWAQGRARLWRIRGAAVESFPTPDDEYHGVAVDAAGAVWTAGGPGLARRAPDGVRATFGTELGFPTLATNKVLVDRDGRVWVGTIGAGVVRVSEPRVEVYSVRDGLPDRVVEYLTEDSTGRVWVATNHGVARVAAGAVEPTDVGLPDQQLSAMFMDRRGRLWLGTGEGIYLREGGRTARLGSGLALGFDAGADGSVWVGTTSGLFHFADGAEPAQTSVGKGAVTVVRVARDGSVWMGTPGGLCRLAGDAVRCFGAADGAPTTLVMALHEDRDGAVWIGTHEGGLYRFRGGRFTRYGTEDGLPSNTHFAMLEDDRGRLWTSSDIGITRIDKARLGRGAAAAHLFDERDGMRTADCMGGALAALRARDGRLWFATTDGVAVIDPAADDAAPPRLNTILDRITLADGVEAPARDLELPAGRGAVTLRFAAPSLAFGNELVFRHRLAGIDADWVASTEPVAVYSHLPPGGYRFAAEARLPPGDWGPAAELAVVVLPFVWQTGWFRVAAALLIVGLAYAAHRSRLALAMRRQRRLEALIDVRTAALADAKRELEEANQQLEARVETAVRSLREAERMAAFGEMVAGVAHEVRQPIFALGTAAFVLGGKLKEREDTAAQISLIQRETKRVNAIMDELLEFARPESVVKKAPVKPGALLREAADTFRGEHDPDATLAVEVAAADLPAVPLDSARMVQVLVNLMGNAMKHAAGIRRIALRAAAADGGRLRIEVENDGAGIPAEALPRIFEPFFSRGKKRGTGLGLAIVRRIVRDHGGEIRVASGEGGTTFTIELPGEPA